MVRTPCVDKYGRKKGSWNLEEDNMLITYIQTHGFSSWREISKHSGLARCEKSCRLRWVNYLCPGVKRGNYTKQEEDTIIKLHQELGNKWAIIAKALPGRTDNEIKNYWHTHIRKKRLPTQKSNHKNREKTSRLEEQHIKPSFNHLTILDSSDQYTSIGPTLSAVSSSSSENFYLGTTEMPAFSETIFSDLPEESIWSAGLLNFDASPNMVYHEDYSKFSSCGNGFWEF